MNQPKQAVLLTAGLGNRLKPFTLTYPKCFASVNNKRILNNALDSLAEHGCQVVNLVVGHHANIIKSSITANYSGMQINYIFNENFKTTNSMYSLALGLENINEPAWILEGDVFFDQEILSINTYDVINWFVDSSSRLLDGAYVKKDSQNKAVDLEIIRNIVSLTPNKSKSIGILKVDRFGLERMKSWLEEGIKKGKVNDYYDFILADHMKERIISICDISGYKWFEIDTQQDLESASKLFAG